MWLPKFDFFQLFIGFSKNMPPPLWVIIPDKCELLVSGTIPKLTPDEKLLIEAYKTSEYIKSGFLTDDKNDGLFVNVMQEIHENERNISTHSQLERYLTEAKETLKFRLDALRSEYLPDYSNEQVNVNLFQYFQTNLTQLEESYLSQNLSELEKENSTLLIGYLKDTLFYLFHYYFAFDILTIAQIKGNFTDGNDRFQEHLREKYDSDFKLTNTVINPNPSNYCSDPAVISKLYQVLLKHQIVDKIEYINFLGCFDLNNTPLKSLKWLNKNMLIYALKKIEKINSKVADTHFGIKNYDSYNNRSMDAKWLNAQQEINGLLENKPIRVRSN